MKQTTIIAVMNHKGGVGKTTTAINVADAMARRRLKVLLIDLDAQASLTYYLRGDEDVGRSMFDAMVEGYQLPIIKQKDNLFVAPSKPDVAGIDRVLHDIHNSTARLAHLLQEVVGQYDYIMLDCPPGLNIMTYNAIAAADHVLVPMEPCGLALEGLQGTIQITNSLRRNGDTRARVDGVLLTRVKERKLHKSIERTTRQLYGDIVFHTVIRDTVKVAEGALLHSSVYDYNKHCYGAKDYTALTSEILQRYEHH